MNVNLASGCQWEAGLVPGKTWRGGDGDVSHAGRGSEGTGSKALEVCSREMFLALLELMNMGSQQAKLQEEIQRRSNRRPPSWVWDGRPAISPIPPFSFLDSDVL